jgi:amino acid adenylation domain-containing protein
VHHIVFDGWSVGVLFRELSELYEALSTGRPLTLAELPIQYADFAKWQKQRYQGERLESQLSYWKTQLENIVTLQLATDRPRQPLQAARGARRYFALSHNLSCELKELSRQHSATLFMTLLAGYQTLLHRYSQQTDIVVGSPVAGRGRQELEQLIGFFLNTVVLRLDLSGNPTFIETIQRTREVCLGALNHQELPFEKLVEELHPDRQPGINPLFQTTFAFQNSPRVSPHLANIRVTELEVEPGIARFDLHLFVEEFEGCLKGYWDYDANLFDGTTIERMLDHFQVLLGGMVVNPNNRIDELQLLTDTEKHQLLVEWNATGNDYPNNKCIHHLFEEQVEKTPDAIALVFNNQQLTYYELNNRANHLAQHLHKVGVGPNALVALCLDRCIEMVVGVLAILKAGGAYLPLDPSYPEERIGFILDDAQPKVVLTHSRFHNLCSSHAGVRIALDLDWNMIADKEDEPLVSQVNPENLAYVIYTSGSTGSPKGVAIQHRALCNHMEWLMAEFPMSNADRVLLKTPYSFDASVWEIFAPLLTGAQLVVANRDGHKDANYLVKAVIFNQITVLQLVPSLLNLLLKETDLNQCTSLKYVFCGGEKLPTESYKQFSALMHCELINLYGPTEACIDATYWRSRVVPSSNDVPIGRPIANTQIYILDTYLNPVPVGVAGELHIGGDGLARGYLNRPELTAEKFIANPFSNEPGARLYKTGDLARYLSDGNIEFLGRIDSQVKIRGFRIELGEIEAVLAQHAAIQQAVVLAREDTPGDKRLVAYIVSTDGPDASVHDLRSYLQQKLPDYMVPSAFMFVDSLPLTPNGKLDRKSLPAPDTRPELEHAFIAPRTPVEEILANIWCTVLKLDKVGIYDNFFHLGGHSLLATQVVSRIRDALKLALPLKTLFGTPTIQGLGQQLEDLRGKQEVTETMQIAPVKREQFSVSKSIYQQ